MKAAAFDKIAKVADRRETALARMDRIFGIIARLERDEKRFWKRMAKFDREVMSGKNRMAQMTRYVSPPIYLDGTKTDEQGHTEIWNPDMQAWERPLPVSSREGN